ncbi:bacteriophage T4 gp5 trimerisation domain-containing protein, partial [Citrobacter freundii]|uniref:bacteriophage T4 gp5 trimerisation domain-containing protein n=1 Tax=Citrobacter freundii TaxID=546 RepID=UPI00387E028A
LNNRTTDVKVDHTETIGNNQSITVGLGQTMTVGKENASGHDRTVTVAHDQRNTTGNDRQVTVKNDRKTEVTHDRRGQVGNDETLVVGNDRKMSVKGKQEQTTTGDHISLVKGMKSLEVKGDLAQKISGALGLKVQSDIVLESSSRISLKVGGSFVVIHPGGVDIMGLKINLNGGGSAGTPVGVMQPGALEALEALADNAGDGKDNRSGDGDNGAGSGVGDDQGYSSSGDDEQDNKEKKITSISCSYGEEQTELSDISRHYVDLNLHMHTLNYDIGENVSCDVFYFTPDGTEDSLSVSADVNKNNEAIAMNIFSDISSKIYLYYGD